MPDIDKAGLRSAESVAARLLRDIDAGLDPNTRGDDLEVFIRVLSARTSAMRSEFARKVRTLVCALESRMAANDGTLIRGMAVRAMDDCSPDSLAKVGIPRDAAQRAIAMVGVNGLRDLILARFDPSIIQSIAVQALGLLQHVLASSIVEDAAVKGQAKGLHSLVTAQQVEPILRAARWSVIETPDASPFILGDGCLVAVGLAGQVGWLPMFGRDWREVYLPIDRRRCLVAARSDGQEVPFMSPEAINRASAGVSRTYFYASQYSPYEEALSELIGRDEPTITDRDVADILDEVTIDGNGEGMAAGG